MAQGIDANLSRLLNELAARDERDTQRQHAPLKPAEESIVLDTSSLSIEQVFDRVQSLANQRIALGA